MLNAQQQQQQKCDRLKTIFDVKQKKEEKKFT